MDYTEKWGKDIDEAVSLALIDLKVSREDVEVTVLEEPTKGFLGLGAKLAKVRVENKKPAQPEKPPQPPEKLPPGTLCSRKHARISAPSNTPSLFSNRKWVRRFSVRKKPKRWPPMPATS